MWVQDELWDFAHTRADRRGCRMNDGFFACTRANIHGCRTNDGISCIPELRCGCRRKNGIWLIIKLSNHGHEMAGFVGAMNRLWAPSSMPWASLSELWIPILCCDLSLTIVFQFSVLLFFFVGAGVRQKFSINNPLLSFPTTISFNRG